MQMYAYCWYSVIANAAQVEAELENFQNVACICSLQASFRILQNSRLLLSYLVACIDISTWIRVLDSRPQQSQQSRLEDPPHPW